MRTMRARAGLSSLMLVALLGAAEAKGGDDKVPITTASAEARDAYLKGRDLNEKLRATDARKQFEAAIAKDPDFALAYVGLANTANTTQDFFDAVNKAVAHAGKASEGEKLLIQGLEAGSKADNNGVKAAYVALTTKFPKDERAWNLLGGFYFGQQDYAKAIESYTKATGINPAFSQPYNQLGYAYRFMDDNAKAETTFKKYIEILPDDPNPYDSYGELLMKLGRFDESIKSYEKALSHDPGFASAQVGIGLDNVFLGKGDQARLEFGKLLAAAHNDGEKRQALFNMAMSYVYEGATDKALAEAEKEAAVAQASKDFGSLAADYNFMGNILLAGGKPDEAAAKFKLSLDTIDKANVPAEVKAQTHRNGLYEEARVALAKNDLATAKAKSDAFTKEVAVGKRPFETWRTHELAGRIATAEKNHAVAVKELILANQQDPEVLYYLAIAYQGKGDAKKAKEMAGKSANWNALGANYGYVRTRARALLAKS